MATPATAARLTHLDGIRGIAALSVFFAHFLQTFLPHIFYRNPAQSHGLGEQEFATSPFNILVNGNFAVCLFFVLSGYVLSVRFLSGGEVAAVRRLALKRYPRLALPVVAATVMAWAISAVDGYSYGAVQTLTLSGMGDPYIAKTSFSGALFQGLDGVFFWGDYKLNPVLWTMQTELTGSFLVFCLLLLCQGSPRRRLILIIACVLFHNGYYLGFLLGMLLADIQVHGAGRDFPYPLSVLLLTLGVWFGSYPYYGSDHAPWSILPAIGNARSVTLYHEVGSFVLILVALRFPEARDALATRPCRFLGRISFSLYLIHFPLVCSLGTGLWLLAYPVLGGLPAGYAITTAAVFLICAPLTILGAAVFTRLIDEPAIRLSELVATLIEPPARRTDAQESPTALGKTSPVGDRL